MRLPPGFSFVYDFSNYLQIKHEYNNEVKKYRLFSNDLHTCINIMYDIHNELQEVKEINNNLPEDYKLVYDCQGFHKYTLYCKNRCINVYDSIENENIVKLCKSVMGSENLINRLNNNEDIDEEFLKGVELR